MTEELKPINVSKYRITETGQVLKNERKDEMKNEMKNRISLALKDPILQQRFEIICKENAELKNKLEHRNCLDCSNHSSNLRMRNLDLEKENAELKARLIAINLLTPELQKASNLRKQQLSNAKELLKKWVELFKSKGGNIPPTPIQVETEQFLNGEGCPDCFCEDCTKDCGIKKLGLVEVEK